MIALAYATKKGYLEWCSSKNIWQALEIQEKSQNKNRALKNWDF